MMETKCVLWLTAEAGADAPAFASRVAREAQAKGYDTALLPTEGSGEESGLANDVSELLARHRLVIVQATLPLPRDLRERVESNAVRLVEADARSSEDEVLRQVFAGMEETEAGAQAPPDSGSYDEDEEEVIRRRLEDLGYL
jgi:hypothetical protein